jgi:hypothetical protein
MNPVGASPLVYSKKSSKSIFEFLVFDLVVIFHTRANLKL